MVLLLVAVSLTAIIAPSLISPSEFSPGEDERKSQLIVVKIKKFVVSDKCNKIYKCKGI